MIDGNGSYAVAAVVLGAFGIAAPLPGVVGGMVVAVGCCFAVMAVRPLEKRRAVWFTLLIGALAGLMAAILSPALRDVWLWGRIPLQAQMGISGALAQAVFEFIAIRGGAFLNGVADRAGLPGAEGE